MTVHAIVSVFASHALLRVLAAFLTVGTLKGLLLVLAAWLLCRLGCRGQPRREYTVWLLALAGLLVLPLAWLSLPPVQLAPVLERAAALAGAPASAAAAPGLSPSRLLGLADTAGGYAALARQAIPGRLPLAARLLLAVWGAGAGLMLLRAAAGRLIARRNAGGSAPPLAVQRLARELCGRLALPRGVLVVASRRCAVPYTFGLLRPVVVLPRATAGWPAARLRAVLLHELAHVKRRDSVANLLVSILTALLWCFPPAWAAAWFLVRARESACDALVLGSGIAAHLYASEVLELVHGSRGSLFVPSESTSLGSRAMVRRRIVSILNAGTAGGLAAAGKTGLVAIGLVCCAVALLAVRWTATADPQPLRGTWTNAQYFGTYWMHTYTFGPGDALTWWGYSAAEEPTQVGRYTIERRWADPAGASWYQLTSRTSYPPYHAQVAEANKAYFLVRVDPARDTLEMEWNYLRSPESFGAMANYHYTYFRKE